MIIESLVQRCYCYSFCIYDEFSVEDTSIMMVIMAFQVKGGQEQIMDIGGGTFFFVNARLCPEE